MKTNNENSMIPSDGEARRVRPYLLQFMEAYTPESLPESSSPERGGETNRIEDEPKSEPTKKTPKGD